MYIKTVKTPKLLTIFMVVCLSQINERIKSCLIMQISVFLHLIYTLLIK